MKEAILLTGWKGSGTGNDPYRPAIADDHILKDWTDTTGSHDYGTPFYVKAHMSDAKLTAVKADPKYGPSAVISETEKP